MKQATVARRRAADRGDKEAWYGETGEWVSHLNEALRERPPHGPEPTDQDLYYDSGQHADGLAGPYDPPWLDNSDDREAECGAGDDD